MSPMRNMKPNTTFRKTGEYLREKGSGIPRQSGYLERRKNVHFFCSHRHKGAHRIEKEHRHFWQKSVFDRRLCVLRKICRKYSCKQTISVKHFCIEYALKVALIKVKTILV